MSGERPAYELACEPDGTSWTARENLHDLIVRELLGPAEGDDEVIDVPPDTRYLLGRIAPTRLRETGALPQAEEESDDDAGPLDLGDDLDAWESRGLPVTAVDETSADADEDTGMDEPVRRGLMIPASMGLRFQVPDDLDAFTVRASWGVYNPKATGEVSATGRSIRRFHRTPVDVPVTVRVAELPRGETSDFPLRDDVVLRVDVYDDPPMRRCLVEVALCNDRATPSRIPVNVWLFQTAPVRRGRSRGGVPAGARPARRRAARTRRRAAPAGAAVPRPARVRHRAHLLGRLAGRARRAAGEQGLDHLAAHGRDPAGHRDRPARHRPGHAGARRGRAPSRSRRGCGPSSTGMPGGSDEQREQAAVVARAPARRGAGRGP